MKKKKDDKEMNKSVMKPQAVKRKKRIQESYKKAVKANGKALEKLSKN
ncbi:hypothetical protein [Lentibacillus jeotgali]|nr:hypothetical protein [Lentibacillus jeotgali]